MRPQEAEAVVEMVAALALALPAPRPRLSAEALRAETAGPEALIDCLVAEADGQLIGCSLTILPFSTWRNQRGIYLCDLYVAPQARGQGLGASLLKAAIARGQKRGARFVKLEVDEHNHRAQSFYERLGFTRKAEEWLFALEDGQATALIAQA